MEKDEKNQTRLPGTELESDDHLINASGHVQELDRNFGFWSICSLALISDNAWAAGGGALVLALYNGGGPGVLYGLIAATFFYCFIGAGLAELASAIPSSANVYHWASVTPGPRLGRVCSWYAGWWNCTAWIFGGASTSLICADTIMAMYTIYHPSFVPRRWQVFLIFLAIVWLTTAVLCFGQKYIAKFANAGGILCLALLFATVMVVAIMPSQTGFGYASNAFVWTEWQNLTGWSSNGLVFVIGMINGAFAIGTPDGVSHCCEEIPNPRTNVPWGIAAQLSTGFTTTFIFFIATLYGVTSLDSVFNSDIVSLPLAAMYEQATRSSAATFALLLLFALDLLVGIPGAWVAAGRMLWTLARDDATPFPSFVSRVSPRWRNPFNAQFICAIIASLLGCIYIGSATAFNAFVASFTVFTTMSYVAALLPHLLTRRKHVTPGPFWIPGVWGDLVFGIASTYILVFNVLYMFPYSYPVESAAAMNWTSVMFAGITALSTLGYLWKRKRGYVGPRVVMDAHDDIMTGLVGRDADRRRQLGGE